MRHLWAVVGLTTVMLSACRLDECPPSLLSNSNVAAQSVPGQPLSIRGRVMSLDASAALVSARVRLLLPDSTWHTVASDGSFTLTGLSAGSFSLEATALGFEPAIGRVAVSGDSAVAVLAVLERSRVQKAHPVCGERAVVR